MAAAMLAAAALPQAASPRPASGPRETVDVSFTTTQPGSSTGFTYSASFRRPGDPGGTPPALRRLVIVAPAGSLADTSVAPRCAASDAELKQRGAAACPSGSRLGTGTADVKPVVFPAVHYVTTVFNADRQQVELLTSDPPAPSVVVRGYFRGYSLDSPIPTCISGGYAPRDCPTDQVSLLRNRLVIPKRNGYFVTPPTCPSSREWRSPVRLYYGDGAVERVTTTQPCVPARTRLSVRPRRARRLQRRRFRFRASVLLGGRWRALSGATIQVGRARLRTDAGGRASRPIRFKKSGRRRARLSKEGYGSSATRVRVRRR